MYRNCRHVHPNGRMCKSPAMRGCLFCYFHARLHGPAVELPPLDNAAGICESSARVIRALASSRIDEGRAKILLYGLQIAASTLNSCKRSRTAILRATPPMQSSNGQPLEKLHAQQQQSTPATARKGLVPQSLAPGF